MRMYHASIFVPGWREKKGLLRPISLPLQLCVRNDDLKCIEVQVGT
jgi:hypothetical protein